MPKHKQSKTNRNPHPLTSMAPTIAVLCNVQNNNVCGCSDVHSNQAKKKKKVP